MITTYTKRNTLFLLAIASFTLMLLLILLCTLHRSTTVASAEEAETSYTTTKRLYIDLPGRGTTALIETKGGKVNDVAVTVAKKRDYFQVHDWYEMYIERVNNSAWNVAKADVDGGKYYYDPQKHAIKSGEKINVYLHIQTPEKTSSIKPYIWNDKDELFHRHSNSDASLEWHHASGLGSYTPLVFQYAFGEAAMQDIQINDAVSYKDHKCNKGTNDWGDDWWTIEGPDDFTTGFGIQPETKTHFLGTMTAGKIRLYISFLFGGAAVGWDHGRGQTAHFCMPNDSYRYIDSFEVDLNKTDNTAPTIKLSEEASKNKISATLTDSSYAYATYTFNGEEMGEYKLGSEKSNEGVYVFTATDSVGNSSSQTGYVDKTAPKFSDEFYAADGKPLIVFSGAKEYVLPFPTHTTRESPIVDRATFIRSYYDSAAKRVVALPAEYYNNGDKLTAEGRYDITVSDSAGNSSTCTVIIDRTAPSLSATSFSKTYAEAKYSYTDVESPITSTYVLTDASGTSAALNYASGMQLYAVGKYIITATDKVGNSSSVTIYVDNTAPNISRSFEYGNTDGSATFSNEEWESPISAVYSFVGESGTSTNITYLSGQALTSDGEYTITATDSAGNVSTAKIVVDRKSPVLIFGDGSSGTSQITRTASSVAWSVERYESPVSTVMSFSSADESKAPSVDGTPYISGKAFTAEGTYTFSAEDAAGNITQATVIIDATPPSLSFLSSGAEFNKYTNTEFLTIGDDKLSGIDKIELYENGQYVQYDFAPRSDNGSYLFRATDRAGNITSKTAVVYNTKTYGNVSAMQDVYKVNAWYVVALPARIFTTPNRDVAGRYSFASYESALAFAIAQERDFRVTAIPGGYMYVAPTNEAVAQKYDTEEALNPVVEKYAKDYISERQTAKENGSDRYFTEIESLVRNNPELPDYLYDYRDMSHIFARTDFDWAKPKLSFISDMQYTVSARYLGDAVEDGQAEFIIDRGQTLKTAVPDYKQGWYLITESDEAGNIEQYLIYADAELPTASAIATTGVGQEEITLDFDYVQGDTLHYISLDFTALKDNIDAFITLKVQKGNMNMYFTQSDELPTLGSDDYTSGKYTVTVFDRSLNALVFDVYIAGAPPTMTHSSLDADKPDCKVSFVASDRYNVITGLTLYKIEYDGSKTVLDCDGNGTPINSATLSYVLTAGGKYGATITDNYLRTVEIEPIFFLKGLPSGKLSGVKVGGRTNQNVSFTFDSVDIAELYTLHPSGERRQFKDYTVQTSSTQTTYYIAAGDDTSFEYLVFLHNADDLSLFVEYEFEIDTVLPEFVIVDSGGNVIEPDGATNKPFSLSWGETGVNVRYYTARSGSLGAVKYNMNTTLSQGTLYYFTLKDEVGNSCDFTVLLDNAVDYTLDGTYNEVNGTLYSNKTLTFTVNEPTQKFDVKNDDGYSIDNGGTLTQAGRYDITVTDNYNNTVTLSIILDFTPPTIALTGTDNGAAVKNDVAISAFDYDYLYLADSKGNKIRDVADGEIFSSSGTYRIIARDHAGNSATATFTIDLSVDYTLSVPSGAVTTDKVTIDTAEPLDITVTLNGVAIDTQTKFTEPGEYELELSDSLGNSVSCRFTIIDAKSQTVLQRLPEGTRIVRILRDGNPCEITDENVLSLDGTGIYAVTLDCGGLPYELVIETDHTPPVVTIKKDGGTVKIVAVDKENVSLKLTCDGSEINARVGQTLDEPGHYVLTVTDELGNVAVYKFDIPFRLNVWAIVAIIVGVIILGVIIFLFIRARRKPRLK